MKYKDENGIIIDDDRKVFVLVDGTEVPYRSLNHLEPLDMNSVVDDFDYMPERDEQY